MQHLLFMYVFLFNRYSDPLLVLIFHVLSSVTPNPKLSSFPNKYTKRPSTQEDSLDSVLTGTMDDSFDSLLLDSHDDNLLCLQVGDYFNDAYNDVVVSHLHGIQDGAHIQAVVA
ncbi:hypothetical protein GUJ93_ZPchr0007g3069 [Zizania palustris]|uniref:Uncharacterized protein n=1 Tax=Zizania palustris TaxID=103762 RepID=A0A8J5TJC8_ZIZPA|nr:hypothetical protein GUJ93_ZPchr0007g3069 [Zizania palustris]